jgi:hypothetical protein
MLWLAFFIDVETMSMYLNRKSSLLKLDSNESQVWALTVQQR